MVERHADKGRTLAQQAHSDGRGWFFVLFVGSLWNLVGFVALITAVVAFGRGSEFLTFGFACSVAALVLLIAGCCVFVRRPWVYFAANAVAVLSLVLVPFGTILGGLMLFGLAHNKARFAIRTPAETARSGRA